MPQLTAEALLHMQKGRPDDCKTPVVIALAGGRAPDVFWLRQLAALYDSQSSGEEKSSGQTLLCCADRGLQYAQAAGLAPALVVGDGDSATAEAYAKARLAGAVIHRHDPAKDDTDLQLLLRELPPCDLIVSGIWGGRFDHLYSAVFSLVGWREKRLARGESCRVLLADEREALLLLAAGEEYRLSLRPQARLKAVSLLPFSADAEASVSGVRWPLRRAKLPLFYPYAVSNELLPGARSFTAACDRGSIGVYLCLERS